MSDFGGSGGYYQILLSRPDSSHQWGFRLEGGVDTHTPLIIQRVTPHSLAERAGLRGNDVVRQLNSRDCNNLTHEQAKMEIIRSGNDLTMTVERGGGHQFYQQPQQAPVQQPYHHPHVSASTNVWKPAVTAVSPTSYGTNDSHNAYSGYGNDDVPLVTHTSLAANRAPPMRPIGTSYNAVPQPFNAAMHATGLEVQTGDGRTKKIVHSQFNSPKGLYSQSNAERTFNETYQQVDSSNAGVSALSSTGYQQVHAPSYNSGAQSPQQQSGGQSMYCGACNEMIKGVFVKVQNKYPMHPACLKCVKCGVGLRNIGYFYLEGQLFCETHAKQVARPPDSGMKPMAVYK